MKALLMGEGDEWPGIRARILDVDAEILVFATPTLFATPTWLGRPSSIARRVLEPSA